ncbi:fibroblast growth factor receptor-like 1 isoform X1 [Alligator sinensis]|uniref:Fibroblast growth factor receptor-like 1 isoform X1 n=3 Tax=Alligator sinensis TaxID=38654 RepID=A0A3Q0H1G9_ALLSI|nr:fibroblast growth factor receptor-like 1 isoform X1 [Alligator sinensis]
MMGVPGYIIYPSTSRSLSLSLMQTHALGRESVFKKTTTQQTQNLSQLQIRNPPTTSFTTLRTCGANLFERTGICTAHKNRAFKMEFQFALLFVGIIAFSDSARGPPRIADKVIHRQSVRLGRTIKLLCPVEGDPPPLTMWMKDGRTIHSGWTRFRVLQQGLKIKEVESDDAGTYICKATNGFGSMNVNYTLIVIDDASSGKDSQVPEGSNGEYEDHSGKQWARPRFTQPAKMRRRVIARPVGSSVRLKCVASGNPRPDITWLKDNKPLTPQEIGENKKKKWTLNLKNLKPEDSGKYTCRVFNRVGEINATYKVEVIRKYCPLGHSTKIGVHCQ